MARGFDVVPYKLILRASLGVGTRHFLKALHQVNSLWNLTKATQSMAISEQASSFQF